MHTMVCKVARLQASMVDKLGREPTVEELSLESGFDESQVWCGMRYSMRYRIVCGLTFPGRRLCLFAEGVVYFVPEHVLTVSRKNSRIIR